MPTTVDRIVIAAMLVLVAAVSWVICYKAFWRRK